MGDFIIQLDIEKENSICIVECFVCVYNNLKMKQYGFALVSNFEIMEERLYNMLCTSVDSCTAIYVIPLSLIKNPLISITSIDEEREVKTNNFVNTGPFRLFPTL